MRPVLQALVLAERVYQDLSGKKIIAGTFNQILIGHVSRPQVEPPDGTKRLGLPGGTDMGCPVIYASFTDVVDGTEITFQLTNVSNNRALFGASFRIEPGDRLRVIEIIAPLPPVASLGLVTGTYSIDVMWNGEILGSHRVLVSPLPNQNEETEQ